MLRELQRDRWLLWLMLLATAALLFLVVRDFGASLPDFPRPTQRHGSTPPLVQVGRFQGMFDGRRVPLLVAGATNLPFPFHTTQFQPRPVPPPTFRAVDLTYQGYLQAGDGPRRALVRVGEALLVSHLGSNLIADLWVSDIGLRTLVLTNAKSQTNVFEFGKKKSVNVPL